jgi:hypothetical protein
MCRKKSQNSCARRKKSRSTKHETRKGTTQTTLLIFGAVIDNNEARTSTTARSSTLCPLVSTTSNLRQHNRILRRKTFLLTNHIRFLWKSRSSCPCPTRFDAGCARCGIVSIGRHYQKAMRSNGIGGVVNAEYSRCWWYLHLHPDAISLQFISRYG